MKRDRLRPVRLGDVPLRERLAAAQQETRKGGDGAELLAVALCPSRRVYWIRADTEQAA